MAAQADAAPPPAQPQDVAFSRFNHSRIDLSKWTIFALLKEDFLSSVRLACVFGNLGNEAIVIKNDDNVYSIGSNAAGCHGVGDMNSTLEPRKLEALSRKGVKSLAYGSGPHVLAVTEKGEVFSWGHNGYCQLGNGNTNHGLQPALIQGYLSGKVVIQVACGSHHSLALTEDGDVYSWGQNNCGQIGTGTTTNQSSPKKVTALFGSKSNPSYVASIACGQTSSMVVLENGEVYGWGYNGNGQLGLGNNINQLNPCRVTALNGLVISKVVCGYAHTLALTDEGDLYAWGANSYGQLGTGNKSNTSSPMRVCEDLGRITDVTASHYVHISAAIVQQHAKVFMWGQCHGQSITKPIPTEYRNLYDVFASFASPAVTPEPVLAEITLGPSLSDSLQLAFDDQSSSTNLSFLVDGRHIHVHKDLLKIRCEYFKTMFQDCWSEDGKDVIEINHFSYPVYYAFLNYLYTDVVKIGTEDAIGLLDLANEYVEPCLKLKCELIIKEGIIVENVAMLYATAIKFSASELEEFCFKFCLNHMTAVVRTDAFKSLDEETVKEFIVKAAKNNAFRS